MTRAFSQAATWIATLAIAGWIVPGMAHAGDAAAGKETFTVNCSSCHGMTGKGDGPVGAVLNPRPRDFSKGEFKFDTDKDGKAGTDADLTALIKNGAGAYGGSPLMAPWPTLSDDDIANLVAFIRTLKQ